MRKGFDRLYGLVRDRLLCEPMSGHLFLFAKESPWALLNLLSSQQYTKKLGRRIDGDGETLTNIRGKCQLAYERMAIAFV